MIGIKDNIKEVKILNPDDAQYYFGYYDLNAYDSTGTKHLCNRATFVDHIPNADDVLELGVLSDGKFEKFAETTAWNFQQGALLQFKRNSDNVVFYNVCKDGAFRTVVHNLKTGEKKYLPKAAACVSPDGKWGLAINFSRIFKFRPGYGYAGIEDPYFHQNRPTEDGVFLMNMETGETRLIIDYERIYQTFPTEGMENEKMVVNHITFNETSDRFMFLLRNFPNGSGKGWGTTLITSDLEGNMHLVLENKFVSHYCWKNGHQILATCAPDGVTGLFLLDDLTNEYRQLKSPYPEGPFGGDIHCLYSPDRRYILGDGYPDKEGYRPLFLYDTETEDVKMLLRSKSNLDDNWDNRCDLHARFNRQGNKVSFDSCHDGKRSVCEIEL